MQSSYTATICFHTVATKSHVTEQINWKFKVPNGSVCELFVDDCKLCKNIVKEADLKELQEDVLRLCHWSKEWLLGFNFKKCKIVF